MSAHRQLEPGSTPEQPAVDQAWHGQGPQQANIFSVLHRLLRGRYLIAITASVIGAVVGGSAGYFLPKPKFRAEGLVHIRPVEPKILYDNEQSTLSPYFASFVATQANLLQHSRVIAKAMTSDAWKGVGRPLGPESEHDFRNALKVVTNREAPELIFVSFTDERSSAAFIAVREVINAYQDLPMGGAETRGVRDMQVSNLTDRTKTLEASRSALLKQISAESADLGTSDLPGLLLELNTKVYAMRIELDERNIDIANPPAPPAENAKNPTQPSERTPEEIAAVDKVMAQLLDQRMTIAQHIEGLQLQGYLENYPDRQRAKAELESVEDSIQSHAADWNHARASGKAPQPLGPATESPRQLFERYQRLVQQADALRHECEASNKKRLEVDRLKHDLEDVQELLTGATHRLDALILESKGQDVIGRIEVILPEAPPSSPTVDPRRKMAIAGLFFGGGFPFAIVALIGLLDRRFRFSDQAANPMLSAPLLGILPELPRNLDSAEQVSAAVHCIHQIRTMLQLSGPKRQVYAVTSPTAGDGKTSLSLSLAMSFAASGARTVLVDFDLIGRGMSGRFRAAPVHSLGAALLGGSLNGCVTQTQIPGLSLVPVGRDDGRSVSRIPRENVDRVLAELKQQFDVVIIDTGPILGSLEANLAAAAADGVLLVVGRGQQQSHVQSALTHLLTLRANVLGLVFNRAGTTDFNKSTSSSSFRSLNSTELDRARPPVSSPETEGFDPLPRSVAIDLVRSRQD